MVNLWDTLPDELQEIILRKSVELCREEYLAAGQARHDRAKKKRGRGLLSADMIRYFMDSTDSMEIINWSFPIELRELEQIIDPPVELLDDIDDYDYARRITTRSCVDASRTWRIPRARTSGSSRRRITFLPCLRDSSSLKINTDTWTPPRKPRRIFTRG